MWFNYDQNNSGGDFYIDEEHGIAHIVIIEADSTEAADRRAEHIGVYFNGCYDGRDCSCCGDRWYRTGGGNDEPLIYNQPAREYVDNFPSRRRYGGNGGKLIAIHHQNGPFELFRARVKDGAS